MELIIIGVVIVLLFGGAQLPKLARSLGGFFSEFNAAKEEAEEALEFKKSTKKAKKEKNKKE
ncbi:sec-independent protein translocase protein TatA [Candidatus Termititenax persephonae]|uniref:Sec-independent protein translocase protein TatA n=1 Tax=Candidatus Termititenax persephonae TaxID=2218525 RepID=A0A388THK1_9BACT|nr:sec-independent protein translocase protein TatA [Candidatus Termititenax persephonae]